MVLTNRDIGEMLKARMEQGYKVSQLGNWAFQIYQKYFKELSPEAKEVISELRSMESGPEFEYTKNELNYLVELLIKEVNDPIRLVNEMNVKFKWKTRVKVNSNAPLKYHPNAVGMTLTMKYIESENDAKLFDFSYNSSLDTQIYLVEFESGERIEIPKLYLSPLENI